MSGLGPTAFGEPVEPGRVDCCLGVPCQPRRTRRGRGDAGGGAPLAAAPRRPQPPAAWCMSWRPGHPDRQGGQLVFPGDLTEELRAWPRDRWAALGIDLDQVTAALVGC